MELSISRSARPQAMTLMAAVAVSVVLWFIPFAELLTYPFRIFVTFIHEGGHAIAALLTGESIESLRVAVNGSGETYTTTGGLWSQVFVASAGYLGSMAYGATLLVLIRRKANAGLVLIGSAALIFALTIAFGLFKPIVNGSPLSGVSFTLLAGLLLSAGLCCIARFAGPRVVRFFVSLLAVQCVLDALLDLKTVFFLSSPFAPSVPTDALNMANATGIPALLWTIVWIAIAFAILVLAMRRYVVGGPTPIQRF